jgi:hypothetical protein
MHMQEGVSLLNMPDPHSQNWPMSCLQLSSDIGQSGHHALQAWIPFLQEEPRWDFLAGTLPVSATLFPLFREPPACLILSQNCIPHLTRTMIQLNLCLYSSGSDLVSTISGPRTGSSKLPQQLTRLGQVISSPQWSLTLLKPFVRHHSIVAMKVGAGARLPVFEWFPTSQLCSLGQDT